MSEVGEKMLKEAAKRVSNKGKGGGGGGRVGMGAKAANAEPAAGRSNGRLGGIGGATGGKEGGKEGGTQSVEGLMEKMIYAKDKETGRPLSDNEIIAQSTTFIAGGTETTASTLSYAIYLISQHPAVEAKILEEVDACPYPGEFLGRCMRMRGRGKGRGRGRGRTSEAEQCTHRMGGAQQPHDCSFSHDEARRPALRVCAPILFVC